MAARILVLCHANIARSPLLAARLRLEAVARGLDGAVEVTSAGVEALWGQPAATGSRVVAQRWGVDLGGHHSRPWLHVEPAAHDLVLTMERVHTRGVVRTVPELEGRVFTAPELAHILADPHVVERLPEGGAADGAAADGAAAGGAAAGAPAVPIEGVEAPREQVPAVVDRVRGMVALADGSRPGRWQHRRGALEVADPVRQGQEVYDRLGERFVDLSAVIAAGLFGPRPDEPAQDGDARSG